MSAISLKSITGITSITTPAGVDNQLTLHTNNTVERLRITSVGHLGLGDNNPDTRLSVTAASGTDVVGKFTSTDARAWVQFRDNSTTDTAVMVGAEGDNLLLRAGSNERLRITSNGDLSLRANTQNVFLGLTANSNAINFTLGSTTGTYPRAYFYGTGNGQSTAGDIFMGTGVGGELRLRSGGAIKLQTNSDSSTIDALYVHAAGTVAVNTFSPDTTYKLDVAGAGQFTTSSSNQQNDFNTGQLTVRNNQSAQGAFIDFRADSDNGTQGVIAKIGGFNTYNGSGYDGLLTFSTRQNSNNTMVERMRIKSDGYVGISTNNPVNKLHVEGLNTVARFSSSSSYVDIKLQNSNNQLGFLQYNGTELRFFANSGSTPTVYIPNGKFGVNTVPSTTLHVKDAVPEIRLTSTDSSIGQSEIVGKLSISTSDPTTPTGAGVVSYIETFSATSNGSDYTTSISNRAGAGGGETRIRLGNALGQIRFYTNTSGNATERLRIDSSGRVLIGSSSNNTNKVGDSALQVYTSDQLHPAIRTNAPNSNGYTMFADAYGADESQVNIGISYSSASLVISQGCKVNTSSDDAYVSSQDSYSVRPTVLRLDTDGSLSFHNTASASTTPTDNAVSLSERFRITSAGKMGVGVTDPKSVIHIGASTDIRIGGQYGGSSRFQLQKAYDSGYTGTHWQFRTEGGISWSFEGVLIVHGTGGSTYGSEVVNIKIVYSRESGATNSGDTWRNGTVDYNVETLEHGQVGLAPSSGELTINHDSSPGGSTTQALLKLGWSSSGQSVGVWSKLIGTIYWGAPGSGVVKIQDKDSTTYINSNP